MRGIAGNKVFGLTGGIGSGKSTVGSLLQAKGFTLIDADQIARELSVPGGAAHAAIAQRFGSADREHLRQTVFNDPAARKDLERILHPLIQAESARRLALIQGHAVYEAALLVEAGRAGEFDGLLVVEAPFDVRKARVMARNGWSPEQTEKVLRAQLSDAERRKAATWVLVNDGTLADLERKVAEWVPLATRP